MTKEELQQLKLTVGKQPFTARVSFDSQDFAECPFHAGESAKSMHLKQQADGASVATCFSECNKSWDAIAFVQELDKVNFPEACKLLAGLPAGTNTPKPKPKPKPMTAELWAKWGREITQADVDAFADSRKHSHTAALEYFRLLSVRVRDGFIGFPYVRTVDGKSEFSGVKMRKLGSKDFILANSVDTTSMFNIDSVNPFENVFIVEGEPDVLTMAEHGFVAVSPFSGKQSKFNPDILKRLEEAPRIFVAGDQDEPGKAFVERIQKLLPAGKTYRLTFAEAKDVGELALKLGDAFPTRIEELGDEATTPFVIRNIPPIHKIPQDPQRWLLDRLLPYGGLAILSGSQGSMKSLTGMQIARCLVRGREFLGRKPNGSPKWGVPVLYLDKENPASEVNKRRERLGIIGMPELLYWGDWMLDLPVAEPDDPRLLEFAAAGGYLIFDSLQQWYGDAEDENSSNAMVEKMNQFKRLARIGAGVLILHHFGKPNPKTGKATPRGSSAITACSDMSITAKKTDEGLVQLRADRFRMCGPWELDFRVHFDERYEEEPVYLFEVVRDQTVAQAAANLMEERAAKAAEKAAKDKADSEAVSNEIQAGHSPRSIKTHLGMSQPRVEKLAGAAGYTWNGEKWEHKDRTPTLPEQPGLSEEAALLSGGS